MNQVSKPAHRLPVYLLVDTSDDLCDADLELLRQGLKQFKAEVAADPFAREVVHVGVISFGGKAQKLTTTIPGSG